MVKHAIDAIVRDFNSLETDISAQDELREFLAQNVDQDGDFEVTTAEWIELDYESKESQMLFGTGQDELREHVFNVISRRFGLSPNRDQNVYPWDVEVFYSTSTYSESAGFMGDDSPILGMNAGEFRQYWEFAQKRPAYLVFCNALYNDKPVYPGEDYPSDPANRVIDKMIPLSQQEAAEIESWKILMAYCDKYDLDVSQLAIWTKSEPGQALLLPASGIVSVDPDGIKTEAVFSYDKYFVPACLVHMHELMHIEDGHHFFPEDLDSFEVDALTEIGPTILLVMLQDEVYKKINDIPLDTEVSYAEKLRTSYGSINLGLVANTFRSLTKKYGSIYKALKSPEAQQFVNAHFSNEAPRR